MKRQVILLLAFLVSFVAAQTPLAKLTHLPPDMPPELVAHYARDGEAIETDDMPEWRQRCGRFNDYVATHWRVMVDRWSHAPGEPIRYSLVFDAAELLPPSEYVLFMDRMLTEYEKGRVDFYGALAAMAPQGFKIGFPNVNYRHPDVRRVLQRYRSLLVAKKHPGIDWCDKILSGALEDQLDDLRGKRGNEILPLDVLPLSGGVKEHGYRVSPVKAVVATAKVFPQVVQTITWIEIVVLGVMAVAAAWLWRLWRRIRQRTT